MLPDRHELLRVFQLEIRIKKETIDTEEGFICRRYDFTQVVNVLEDDIIGVYTGSILPIYPIGTNIPWSHLYKDTRYILLRSSVPLSKLERVNNIGFHLYADVGKHLKKKKIVS